MSRKDAKGKFARWILTLTRFDFEVIHRPGTQNKVADAISRSTSLPEAYVASTENQEEETTIEQNIQEIEDQNTIIEEEITKEDPDQEEKKQNKINNRKNFYTTKYPQ